MKCRLFELTCTLKSFTHFLIRLEKYISCFRKVIDNSEKAAQALEHLSQFWSTSEIRQVMICDKLLTYRVVDHLSIVNWVFMQEKNFTKNFLWQILTNTVNTMADRARLCESEIEKTTEEERKNLLEGALQNANKELRELFLMIFQV